MHLLRNDCPDGSHHHGVIGQEELERVPDNGEGVTGQAVDAEIRSSQPGWIGSPSEDRVGIIVKLRRDKGSPTKTIYLYRILDASFCDRTADMKNLMPWLKGDYAVGGQVEGGDRDVRPEC